MKRIFKLHMKKGGTDFKGGFTSPPFYKQVRGSLIDDSMVAVGPYSYAVEMCDGLMNGAFSSVWATSEKRVYVRYVRASVADGFIA